MRRIKLLIIITATILLINSITTTTNYTATSQEEQKPFHIGITYCGNSTQEAKHLIDKVKGYTNLFVLQSGAFMGDIAAMEEIGDYAVASNLSYAVYGSAKDGVGLNNQALGKWLIEAKERWGEQFIGLYHNDESGGDMLDKLVDFEIVTQKDGSIKDTVTRVIKPDYGQIIILDNKTSITYYADGKINVPTSEGIITYYPNGTITVILFDFENFSRNEYTYTSKNITQCPFPLQSYEEVLKKNPIQSYDDAARVFVNKNKDALESIDKKQLDEKNIAVFTADYGLYWWDYQSGYDLVLAELAWNHSVTQHIGLVRGAANLQEKSWGTILTWKYTHPPYLPEGEEMFEHMEISYRTGAEYVIIFNYSEDPKNPNTLQEEHFLAIERFWNEVVQNPKITHGDIKAEAALVLPQNYGWGMRNPNDIIWGIWYADDASQKIWSQLQDKINQHGLKLDIVFEDPNYPIAGKYEHIYYVNQKIPMSVIVLTILLISILAVLFVIIFKIANKKHKTTKIS